MNYSARINLLRLNKAFITPIQGNNETKNCLVIPIQDAFLHETYNQETGKLMSVNLDISAWGRDDNGVDQYGHTHGLKQQLTPEERASLTEDQQKALPFLGNLKPMRQANVAMSITQPVMHLDNKEDLPF